MYILVKLFYCHISIYYKILGLIFWGFIKSKGIMVKGVLVSLIKNLGAFVIISLHLGGVAILFSKNYHVYVYYFEHLMLKSEKIRHELIVCLLFALKI